LHNSNFTVAELAGTERRYEHLSNPICVIVLCNNLDFELGRIFDVVGTSVMFELTLLATYTSNFKTAHIRDLFFP
jgi:hypothetical protein